MSDEVMETREGEPIDLRESGLLWLINATCLHPRGFALGIRRVPGDVSYNGVAYEEFVLLGDGSEPWAFELPNDERDRLFAAAQRTLRPR